MRSPEVVLAGTLLASTFVLSGCVDSGVEEPAILAAEANCIAYNVDGTEIYPKQYPLGEAAVRYATKLAIGQDNTGHSVGIIEQVPDGGYVLDVKGLPDPSNLGVDLTNYTVITASTPETGDVSLTAGCLEDGIDANGIPTTFINLPTDAKK